MAINPKSADNIQVYRGALPAMDVFAQNSGAGCCAPNVTSDYDKLGTVVHFDNALAHLNPKGANVPSLEAFQSSKKATCWNAFKSNEPFCKATLGWL